MSASPAAGSPTATGPPAGVSASPGATGPPAGVSASPGATGPPAGVSASPGATGPPAGVSAAPGATGPPAGAPAGATGPPAGAGGAGGPPSSPPLQLSPLETQIKGIIEMNRRVNIGSYLIGLGLDMVLIGILMNQFLYWRSWATEEKLWRKCTVYWVCLVALASTCFGIAHLFHLFVWNYEKFVQFLPIDWFNWYPLFAMMITVPIQAYFARRAWRLNEKNFFIPLIIAILLVGEMVGCINQKVLETTAENFQRDSLNRTKAFVILHFACNAAIQIVLFSTIVVGLFRKPNGPLEGAGNFFVKFLKMTNESQFFPTVVSLLMLLWYSARPTSHFLVFWMIIYPKISAVCFLAQVNSRITLRQKTASEQSTGRNQDASIAMPRSKVGNDTVQISTDIYVSELNDNDLKQSVNRGPYPSSSSSDGDHSHSYSGDKESQTSAWSPTTWEGKRKPEAGRMV